MKPLNRILIILIFFFVSQAAKADLVTLKNLAGVEIRAEILSATEETVTLKRSRDGRTFTIGIKTLDDESIALVNKWKVADSKKLKKPLSFTIGNKVETVEVTLLVPEGEYNTSVHSGNTIKIMFDTGTLELTLTKARGTTEELLKAMKKGREEYLASFTPKERKKQEPLMKIVPLKCGEFDGFRAENRRTYYGQFLTDGFRLSVNFGAGKGSPITEATVPSIIGTIKVEGN